MNKNHSTAGWEEEFDERWKPYDCFYDEDYCHDEVKEFIHQVIQQKLDERTREIADDIILYIDDLIDRPYFARLKKEEIKQKILSKYNIE